MAQLSSDRELAQKAKLIREINLFGDGSEATENKQLVFYTVAGIKPLSEVLSLHLEKISKNNFVSIPDDEAEVIDFLQGLGLCTKATGEGQYLISRNPTLIAEYSQALKQTDSANIYRKIGTLFGYPATAVEACVQEWAYGKESLLTYEEQDAYVKQAGLSPDACVFRLSKANYKAEIIEVKRWHQLLEKYQ